MTIGTTIYNISEVLDKELEIKFQLELLKNRYSADEIIRYARNRSNYPKNIGKLNEKSKLKLFGSLSKSVKQLLDDFVIFHLNNFTKDDYEILEELITEEYLQSQDALIVLATSKLEAYFLTKNKYLLKSPKVNKLMFVYDPSDYKHRNSLLKEISAQREYSV